MEVEFTARQVKISKALRTQAEEGMERIARILGKTAHASVTFGAQRHLQIVELTVQARLQTIAATGKAAGFPDQGATRPTRAGSRRGQAGTSEAARLDRGALVSVPGHGGGAAHPEERGGHCSAADDD